MLTLVWRVVSPLLREPSEAIADLPNPSDESSVHDEAAVVMGGLRDTFVPMESTTWVDPATIDLDPTASPAPLEELADDGITTGGFGGLGLGHPPE